MRVYDGGDLEEDVDEHRWIPTIAVVARNEADFGVLAKSELWPIRERDPRQRVWTDDYSNVVGALLRHLRIAPARAATNESGSLKAVSRPMPRPGTPLGGCRRGVLLLAALQRREDRAHQLARRLGADLDRDALAPAVRGIDEVDAERVVERRMERMVVIDVRGVDLHPAAALGAAGQSGFLDDV